jgi:Secretion system C-terminal sorting domain
MIMKKLVLIFTLFALLKLNAQTIPNPSFEKWSGGMPIGWVIYDPASDITQSTDHYSGNYSIKLSPSDPTSLDLLYFPYTFSNTISHYLNGYIKTNLVASDSFILNAYFIRNSDQKIAQGYEATHSTRTNWTPFHLTINIPTNFTPDKYGVSFTVMGSTSSYVLIDSLFFSNTPIGNEFGASMCTGVENVSNQTIHSTIYPNPTNGTSEIRFSLTSSSNIVLNIYDITGRLVKTVLNEKRAVGVQQILVNTTDFQNGIYFYTITGEGFNETQKFSVSK